MGGAALAMIIGGLALLVLTVVLVTLMSRRHRALKTWVRVPAVVVENQSTGDHWRPIWQYPGPDGRSRRFEDPVSSSFAPRPGARGVLLVDPADPARVSRQGRDGLIFAGIIGAGLACLLGLLLLGLGVSLL